MSAYGDAEAREFDVEGMDWGASPDVTALNPGELRALLSELTEEERVISYRRRVLQGRIDLIRTELVRRGGASLSPEDLARVLMGPDSSEDKPGEASAGRGEEAT
ncbi:MAG: hypothetical protein WKF44_01165 [Rubrobacteraceae bacterium]|jgi:hypothetical protein|nr:hypothetical protein [Rubrobacter sp.]